MNGTKIELLEREAEACEKARKIRLYVDRAREAGQVLLPTDLKVESLQEWRDFARRYADALDPVCPKQQA